MIHTKERAFKYCRTAKWIYSVLVKLLLHVLLCYIMSQRINRLEKRHRHVRHLDVQID